MGFEVHKMIGNHHGTHEHKYEDRSAKGPVNKVCNESASSVVPLRYSECCRILST